MALETQEQVNNTALNYCTHNFILVDLFCIHLHHTLTIIHYIKVYFVFVLLDCVCYNKDFVRIEVCYIEVLLHTFYGDFGRAEENHYIEFR